MRQHSPFRAEDLSDLDALFNKAEAVVAMREIFHGKRRPRVIGLRHDVDDNQGSWQTALQMARWEAERGYRSTYFLLHSASYWRQPGFFEGVQEIAELGHEVGIHLNALATAIKHGGNPVVILSWALGELRTKSGVHVIGSVAHGDEACRDAKGNVVFVNDEMFVECARPEMGDPNRQVGQLRLDPWPMAYFDLKYDANRLPKKFYASDSGGNWSKNWVDVIKEAVSDEGQLHMLIHPDWWGRAFQT